MHTQENTPETPAAAPAAPTPAFAPGNARAVPARRHEPTARTVAYEQPGDAGVHLFSATGQYVATETAAETAALTGAEADAPPAEAGGPPTA